MDDKTLVQRLRQYVEEVAFHQETTDGPLIDQAADTIEAQAEEKKALQSRTEALEAALRETMSRCTDCGGRGSFVKHDEVTDRDLWESCASCAVGYAALEGEQHVD